MSKMKFFLDTDLSESSLVITVNSEGLPEWASWVAVDESGEVWAFEDRPIHCADYGEMWANPGDADAVLLFRVAPPDWADVPFAVTNWLDLRMEVRRDE